MFISDAPAGVSFMVKRVVLAKEVGKRLADMGFTEGAEGEVVRGGFLRGPLQVRIRGYDILIRRNEAAGVEIEPLGDWPAILATNRPRQGGGWGRWRGHGFGGRRNSGGGYDEKSGCR